MDMIGSINYHADSHVGLKRSQNEDCYSIVELESENASDEKRFVFAVADGIGGDEFGEIASRMACERLSRLQGQEVPLETAPCKTFLRSLFFSIDLDLKRYAALHPECLHMGTTLSCLVLNRDSAIVSHVGDSRIYRLRGGAMEQLTSDHTFVQEMIDMGEVTPGGAKHHPLRNVLTRAIGTQERLEEVDVFSFEVKSADRFLLCSDGLTDMVSGEAIASILNGGKDLESTARELMHAAIQNGGKDNVTLVAIDVNASKS